MDTGTESVLSCGESIPLKVTDLSNEISLKDSELVGLRNGTDQLTIFFGHASEYTQLVFDLEYLIFITTGARYILFFCLLFEQLLLLFVFLVFFVNVREDIFIRLTKIKD